MKKAYKIFLFILWIIPCSFIAMYCDKYVRSVVLLVLYPVAIVMPLILAYFMHKIGYKHIITLMSAVNRGVSVGFSQVYLADVSYYFKPLNHVLLVWLLCSLPYMYNFFRYRLYDFNIKKQGK